MRRTLGVVVSVMVSLVLLIGAALPVDAALPLKTKRCGALITSSFKLGNNLTCDEDGLKIGASGITIDLNGKTLRGDGGDDDNGIENIEGFDRVVIMSNANKPRAKILGFHDGIKIGSGTNRNTVRRIVIDESVADGIDIDGGSGNRIIRVFIDSSGENGVELAGNGATLDDARVWGSGENGIEIVGGNATLRDVEVLVAQENGIDLRGSDSTLLRGFTSLVELVGTRIEGNRNSITKSLSGSNVAGGFHVIGSENDVARNKANLNGDESVDPPQGFGIRVQGDSNTVELNIAKTNDGDGIVVGGILNTVSINTVCGNTGTQILDNGTDTFLEGNITSAECP